MSSDGLHTMDPTGRFSDRAADYRAARPDYAGAVVDAAMAGLDRSRAVVADIGAGTGIIARQVAERLVGEGGVIAVEPNAAMREAAEAHERVSYRDGTGEATGLGGGSVDLIVCAQAFHWLRAEEALAEFARVLRPGARAAIIWNERDVGDTATAEYGRLMREASGNHPAETRSDAHVPLYRSDVPRSVEMVCAAHGQWLSLDGLLLRARSSSYSPKAGPAWERLARGLAALHGRWAAADGRVRLAYVTAAHLVRFE